MELVEGGLVLADLGAELGVLDGPARPLGRREGGAEREGGFLGGGRELLVVHHELGELLVEPIDDALPGAELLHELARFERERVEGGRQREPAAELGQGADVALLEQDPLLVEAEHLLAEPLEHGHTRADRDVARHGPPALERR